jgi:hypothetical protein
LNLAAAEFDVVIAELVADRFLIFTAQFKHRRIEVDAYDFALGSNDLGDDVASLAAARSEIEDRFTFMNIPRRIAAAVILFDDFVGDDL